MPSYCFQVTILFDFKELVNIQYFRTYNHYMHSYLKGYSHPPLRLESVKPLQCLKVLLEQQEPSHSSKPQYHYYALEWSLHLLARWWYSCVYRCYAEGYLIILWSIHGKMRDWAILKNIFSEEQWKFCFLVFNFYCRFSSFVFVCNICSECWILGKSWIIFETIFRYL